MKVRYGIAALIAAAGCAGSVLGAPPNKEIVHPMHYSGTLATAYIEYHGVRYPARIVGQSDDNVLIYENGTIGTPAAFGGASLPNWHVMDQVSFSPGPGAGAGRLINAINLNLGMRATVTLPNQDIDILVTVWDTLTPTATPVTSNQDGNTLRVAIMHPTAGWQPLTYGLTGLLDLSALPGGGIQTSDDQIYLDLAYVNAGGNSPGDASADATVTHADLNVGAIQTAGSSLPTYWRDASGDGTFDPTEERQFTAPAVANFIIAMQSNVTATTCYANCDGSTTVPFLNVNDFVCFQSAFAAGASYANCDGSTAPPVLNISDFVCFQGAFAAGCSAP
jgi:hypothetical protein